MSVLGLSALFDKRLPINRKERYYTGTVLPLIVASDGFKHFDKFLALCGVPNVSLDAKPDSSNIQFLTEYGFQESLKDGAECRFCDPGGRYAPDLVVYIESGRQSLLLSVEAKVFDRPSEHDIREQLKEQGNLLSVMQKGICAQLGTQPYVYQVALLPKKLGMPDQIGDVPVVTWEKVVDTFTDISSSYWIKMLNLALSRYGGLAAKPSSGRQNCDAIMAGDEILSRHKSDDTTYTWMGRTGGLRGKKLQEDVETGNWKNQEYEVRKAALDESRNWFPIAKFIKKIESRSRDMQLTAIIEREGDGYVALCPQLDIASQGETVGAARENLKEALELFFETAGSEEVSRRLRGEVYVTQVKVSAAS